MTRITIPFSEFNLSFSRSSGPGGQNVNKVESKVTLSWDITASPSLRFDQKERFIERFKQYITRDGMVQITCQQFRSQKDNIDDCVNKLHAMVEEIRRPPKIRRATKPTRSSVMKRLNSKKKDSEKKKLRKVDY